MVSSLERGKLPGAHEEQQDLETKTDRHRVLEDWRYMNEVGGVMVDRMTRRGKCGWMA